MSGFDNEVLIAKNADFSTAGANKGSVANGLNANGKMWIGSTTPNVGGTQVNVGTITSPDGSIDVGYSTPNITLTSAAFREVLQQTFYSSGTYIPKAGMKYCVVEAVGGGGGSGGAGTTAAGQVASGGGGGYGMYVRCILTAAQIGASRSVTIGSGGTAGANTGGSGGSGGSTQLSGGLISAGGGGGGGGGIAAPISNAAGGTSAGGGGTGTTVIVPGQGGLGSIAAFSVGFNIPGSGGNSYFGGGVQATIIGVGAGSAPGTSPSALSVGCGASGAAVGENTPGVEGASGASGFMLITEYV